MPYMGRIAIPGEHCHCGEDVQPSFTENPAEHHGAGPSAYARQLHHQHGLGQLVADEDHHVFHQMFLLKNICNAWFCTKDMFRLALHNFVDHLPARHSCSFLFPILFTLLQILQISHERAEPWWEWPQCAVCMMFRCQTSYIRHEKLVLFQHMLQKDLSNLKGCVSLFFFLTH